MSSILKAIRKIEDDKRSRDNQAPDLMVDHGEPSPRSRPVLLPPLVTGLFLGAFTVVIVLMLVRSDDHEKYTMSQTVAQESSKPETKGAEPALAASRVTSSDRDQQDGNFPVVKPSENENNKVEAERIQSHPVVSIEPARKASVKQNVSLEKLYAENKIKVDSSSQENSVSEPVLPKGADLKVSEIFFQEDESSRMAVVNDLPVMVGTYVGDFMVQSINNESVTFQSADKVFSVAIAPH